MTIEVTFVDVETGEEFGRTAAAQEDLPPLFLTTTRLTIEDCEWRVERAAPPTRAEYAASGTLRLELRRVPSRKLYDPAKINYSMSSISQERPPVGKPVTGELVPSMHEDLWRDVELVGAGHDGEIEANFAAIRRVRAEFSRAPGFTRIHVRTGPNTPLDQADLTLEQLVAHFGARVPGHITLEGYAGCVAGGFSVPVHGGLLIYGLADAGGNVTIAGVDHRAGDASGASEPLADFLRAHRLSLVDWRGCLRIDATATATATADTDADGTARLAAWLRTAPQHLWR